MTDTLSSFKGMNESSSQQYKSVIKTTALFGGVQGVSAILSLIRNKAIALLLGIEGVGLISLLSTSLQLIQSFTSLGVDRSGVREIAAQECAEKEEQTATVVRFWTLILGLLGGIIMFFVAPLMSQLFFGNSSYTFALRLLSVALFFETITKGNLALFQGKRMMSHLAKSSLWGAVGGLVVSLPLYALFGFEAIAPSMVISAVVAWGVTRYYLGNKELTVTTLTTQQRFDAGKPLIRLGVAFTLSSISGILSAYLFSLYLTRQAGLEELGLYQAGYNLVMRYVGLLFAAMATDYYPQLTRIATNRSSVNRLLNRQSEIALLLFLPIALLFILFIEPIILILLSDQFLPILPFVLCSILGIVVKVLSWAMGFVILAKGLSRLFWITELISAILFLVGNIVGYSNYGITGIGISYVVVYSIYLLILTLYLQRYYAIGFSNTTLRLFALILLLVLSAIAVVLLTNGSLRYATTGLLLLFSLGYTWRELDKRIAIKTMIQNKFRKR